MVAAQPKQSDEGAAHLRMPLGHAAQEQALLRLLSEGNFPQTLLFHGSKGIGKAMFAQCLATYLLTGGTGQAGLFGEASLQPAPEHSAIQARVLGRSHGDLLWIEPEFSGQNQTPIIKVDAARKVAEFFSKTAAESAYRIAVIDGADALNMNAANALLKIVEEPPVNGLIILISHHIGKMLPTLLSRCRKMAFLPPKEDDFMAILQNDIADISSEMSRSLYHLAQGSAGRALQLHSLDMLRSYERFLELLADYPRLSASKMAQIAADVEKGVKNGAWGVWGELWLLLIARLNLASAGIAPEEIMKAEAALLQHVSHMQTPEFWQECYQASGELLAAAHGLHLDRKQVIQSLAGMLFNDLELQL